MGTQRNSARWYHSLVRGRLIFSGSHAQHIQQVPRPHPHGSPLRFLGSRCRRAPCSGGNSGRRGPSVRCRTHSKTTLKWSWLKLRPYRGNKPRASISHLLHDQWWSRTLCSLSMQIRNRSCVLRARQTGHSGARSQSSLGPGPYQATYCSGAANKVEGPEFFRRHHARHALRAEYCHFRKHDQLDEKRSFLRGQSPATLRSEGIRAIRHTDRI
jgi:hypothetical protein